MTAAYSWDCNHRGNAIIFNNKDFSLFKSKGKILPSRDWNDDDANRLTDTLEDCGFDMLGLDKTVDLTVDKMEEAITTVAGYDHTLNAAIVLAFLTYGGDGMVYAKDDMVPLERLLQPLKADKCTSLAGKPKVIILQTCPYDPFVAASGPEPIVTTKTIPSEADFIYLWSSVPVQVHDKDPGLPMLRLAWSLDGEDSEKQCSGSMFIQIFCDTIAADKAQLSLTKVMTKVTRKVAKQLAHGPAENWQWLAREEKLPLCITMLTKELYLPDKPVDTLQCGIRCAGHI